MAKKRNSVDYVTIEKLEINNSNCKAIVKIGQLTKIYDILDKINKRCKMYNEKEYSFEFIDSKPNKYNNGDVYQRWEFNVKYL